MELATFLISVTKDIINTTEGRVYVRLQVDDMIHSGEEGIAIERQGSWSCRLCTQEAARERIAAAQITSLFLFSLVLHRMGLPTLCMGILLQLTQT